MDLGLFSLNQKGYLMSLAAIMFSCWQRIDPLVCIHGAYSYYWSSQTEVYKDQRGSCDDAGRSLGFYNSNITSSQ